jgi:transcriptional regulator with XRE-family HTH domain
MYYGRMKTLTAQQAIQALIANGYTQNDIAKAASVDQTTVSRILRGAAPNVLLSTSERILKAHRLTLGDSE